jgi:hypothetical protein
MKTAASGFRSGESAARFDVSIDKTTVAKFLILRGRERPRKNQRLSLLGFHEKNRTPMPLW